MNPKTIRYYESIGLLPEPERTPAGYRVYDSTDEDLLTFIRTAQRLGMTLDEVREILAFRDRGEKPCTYVRAVLRREVIEIDQRISDLQRLREDLLELDALADDLPEGGAACRLMDHVRQREATTAHPSG